MNKVTKIIIGSGVLLASAYAAIVNLPVAQYFNTSYLLCAWGFGDTKQPESITESRKKVMN